MCKVGDAGSVCGLHWCNVVTTGLIAQGLEDAIGVSVVHPTWQKTKPDDPSDEHYGWTFASPDDPPFQSPNGTGPLSRNLYPRLIP